MGLLLLATLTGCQSSWRYDWGNYEASVAALYASPSDTPGYGEHIQKLQEDIRLAQSRKKANEPSRVPPGKFAQLGYLYALQGDSHNARINLEQEKTLYPESARFVDSLLEKVR
ncbi:MAG: DUF4810 domain-containing protein [Phycisphaerales bacterium]|nr:DUF4810 domain-containing protein [Phycisphaerales bacterium]